MSEWIKPGFVDLQVNGFAGVDYNDPEVPADAIRQSLRTMFSTGVTRVLPTIITGAEERLSGCLRNLAAAKRGFAAAGLPEAEAIAGFHVEGPHISPEDGPRGAHPRRHVRPPDVAEFERLQEAAGGLIRLVTLAPEWPEAPAYIRHLVARGVVASIGHTLCTREQLGRAVEAGATMSTHLGNGVGTLLHKTANPIWEQLADDRLTACFIVDGIHLPEEFLKAAIRAKTPARSVLVTDAVAPALCAPGDYLLGDTPIRLTAGNRVMLRSEDRLAGSALRMDEAIGNVVRVAGVGLDDALRMASAHPARAAGLAGAGADRVRFRWDGKACRLTVLETSLAGSTVYAA